MAVTGVLLGVGSVSLAQDVSLPSSAERTFDIIQDPGVYALPIGVWTAEAGLPTRRIEGRISVEAWRLENAGATPFQMAAPLRDDLSNAGFEIVLDCAATQCGGFDFRFATTVLPAPEMFVDLTDFHVISGLSPEGAVSILTSRDDRKGYVQIIRAGTGAARGATDTKAAPVLGSAAKDIATTLEAQGHVVLRDLVFQTGSSSLGDGTVASLDALAAYLVANPKRQILFVGHTDAVGSLEGNQALSRKRAQAAVDYLRKRHNIPAAQIGANGVGFLSPRASNLTAEGRETNRRVEAVLISTK